MKRVNILIGALSLVIAVILWGYVALVLNPEGERKIDGIPVEFTNEKALASRNLILTAGRDATVSVRFTGRIQDLAKIKPEDLRAVVDLGSISTTGDIPREYTLRSANIGELSGLSEYKVISIVNVTIDRIEKKYVDLSLDFAGDIPLDYMRGQEVFEPERIQVTGPSKVLDTISKAVAHYGQDQIITRSVDVLTDFTLYTESDQKVDMEHLVLSDEEITLRMPVSMIKTVPLVVTFVEGGGITEKNILCDITPKEIRIQGDPDILADIKEISLAQINLTSLSGDLTEDYPIRYPVGVSSVENIESARAVIRIVGASTRWIGTNNINVKGLNLPDGYTYSLSAKMIPVQLRGTDAALLEQVESNNIRIVADFTDETITGPGHKSRTGTVHVDGFEGVGVVDTGYEVRIDIVPEDPLP